MQLFSKFVATLAIAGAIGPVWAQSGKEPLVLKPSSAWHVDYADDRCRLGRQFGEGDDQVFAFFDSYGPGEYFRLIIAGKKITSYRVDGEGEVQFGPDEPQQKHHFFAGQTGEIPSFIFSGHMRVAPATEAELRARESLEKDAEWPQLAPIGEARLKAVKYLTIGKPLRRAVTLETGSMRAPFAALDKCIDNLMTTWGVDVAKHATLKRKATPAETPGRWVIWSDYPLDMLQSGQPAIVQFRLSVGVDGNPTACHIQSTTRPKEFDDAVCKSVMRRARFQPALDAEGQPIASYYLNTVRFQIP